MENKKSKKIIIGVICAVVAVALVIAVLAITGIFSKDPNEGPSTTESTTKAPRYDPTKYEFQGIDDKAYLVLLDEDGKAIINDKNQINVVDRDSNGEIIKDEKGEPQTSWVQIDTKYVVKDRIETNDYIFNIVEGWEARPAGHIVKHGSKNSGILIKPSLIKNEKYDAMSLDEFLEGYWERKRVQDEARTKKGFVISGEKKEIKITDKQIPAVYYVETIKNQNGELVNYIEELYFELDGNRKYKIEYLCVKEENYNLNKDFSFVDYINKNFVIK